MSLSTSTTDSGEYIEPEIVDYGDLAELTAGSRHGERLDADFPAGTRAGPPGWLSFS